MVSEENEEIKRHSLQKQENSKDWFDAVVSIRMKYKLASLGAYVLACSITIEYKYRQKMSFVWFRTRYSEFRKIESPVYVFNMSY